MSGHSEVPRARRSSTCLEETDLRAEAIPLRCLDGGPPMPSALALASRTVDLARGEVRIGPQRIALTAREVAILRYLYRSEGRAVPREELHRELWDHTRDPNTRAADFAIRRLRAKLEDDPTKPRVLRTHYGRGYSLEIPTPLTAPQPTAPDLVGREEELEHLRRTFVQGTSAVTILGPGGIGKTALARTFGATLCQRPTTFCDLSEASDLSSALSALEHRLGLSPPANTSNAARTDRLLDALGSSLLILDRVDHIPGTADALLGRARGSLPWLLVTSRMRLNQGATLLLEPLSAAAAKELFIRRLGTLRGTREVSAAIRREVGPLVEGLEGVPLELELAAARGRLFTPSTLHGQLSRRLDLLREGTRRSLRETIDGSWALLDDRQRRAFAQCGVFPGPFSLEAAVAMLVDDPEPLEVLEALCDRSLIRTWTDPQEPRLRLFASLRAYACEKLDELGLRATTEARYRRWVLQQGRALLDRQRGASETTLQGLAGDILHAHGLTVMQDPAQAPAFLELIVRISDPTQALRCVRQTLDALPPDAPPHRLIETRSWSAALGAPLEEGC